MNTFEIDVSVLAGECGHVTVAFGPMEAGDVADLVNHIADHKHEFRHLLVEHVATAVLAAQ